MALLKWGPWGAAAAGAIAALVFYGLMRGAQGQRDAARAELQTVTLGLEVEKASTQAATGALERCGAASSDANARCDAAVADLRAEGDRLRGAIRRCQSVDALIEQGAEAFK